MTDRLRADLAADWRRLLARCGATTAGEAVLGRLVRAYREPARHYHTLGHVGAVLESVYLFAPALPPPPELELAAWFHDAVHDPRAGDNEERSAALARREIDRLGLPPELAARIAELILFTREHRAPPDDRDAPVLLDADLAILGAPPAAYTTYAKAIRREYAWVPQAAYRAGRRRVLTGFLQRPRLFATEPAWRALEEPARRNLAAELATLAAPVPEERRG